jgi:TolB-like protein/Tfp pilus assembly protein PilF
MLEVGHLVGRTAQQNETPSIAVLAFANRSASADDEYFADGLADELLGVLAKIKGLRVIARTSSFVFKGKNDDVSTIGRKLNVATLLEGSVRKSGNRARISVQLVRCADSSHLWSETYDRTLDDIFAVQDDIAQCIVTELRAALLGLPSASNADVAREIALATETRPENPEVQQKCQQAQFLLERRSRESIEHAIDRFREAIAIDPQCSSAFSGLAHALGLLSTHLVDRTQDLVQQSHEATQTALRLDPRNASAYLALAAHALVHRRNHLEWIAAMDKALELAPQNSQVLRLVAQRHMTSGALDDAQACLDRALAIDPLSATIRLILASLAMLKQEYATTCSLWRAVRRRLSLAVVTARQCSCASTSSRATGKACSGRWWPIGPAVESRGWKQPFTGLNWAKSTKPCN